MGTRGSVLIAQEKEVKGYYNHFDSYLEGLGEAVLVFVKKVDAENGWDKFKENFKKVKLVSETSKPSKEFQKRYKKFSNENVGNSTITDWYCLLRELQGDGYLNEIYAGEIEHMIDGTNFPKDSLFCEYAYLIDLDSMTLDFYVGFQQKSQKGNRFGTKKDGEYYPCAKVGSLGLVGISQDDKAMERVQAMYKAVEGE